MSLDRRPLVAHVMHRFDTGGLENGVVNLINRLPAERYRHAVIALTEVSDFRLRIHRDDVSFHALHKPPGQGVWQFARMHRLLRELAPDIVHTRNLAALEMTVPAACAGVAVRIHGEHGWDVNDPDGRSARFRIARRLYRPFVHRYVALSRHLRSYLLDRVGIPARRVAHIYNGVDAQRFRPGAGGRAPIGGSPFVAPELWLVGTVGRLQAVKHQDLLARAFVRALELAPHARQRLRLVMAGDGPLRASVQAVLDQAGAADLAWLAGERNDVHEFMRGLDAFALPSLAEGISNTILEAMASALPVVATRVGGNAELIEDDRTGRLVPSDDVEAMACALLADLEAPRVARQRGAAARAEVERRFSLDAMVASYDGLYQESLAQAQARGAWQPRFT
jgi:sugar transferase (PEP-CTERM/EpsH1 system associated)